MQLLKDRVLVLPDQEESISNGGIIIPDMAKETPHRGTVIIVGPGNGEEPMTVKEGDRVLYGKYAGTDVPYEGKDHKIVRESDILMIYDVFE